LDTDFDVPIQAINQWIKLNLEAETYPPPPNNIISKFQWALEVGLKLGARAKLCTIQFLALLDSSEHPGMAILYIR
jgi:hypothetical protein